MPHLACLRLNREREKHWEIHGGTWRQTDTQTARQTVTLTEMSRHALTGSTEGAAQLGLLRYLHLPNERQTDDDDDDDVRPLPLTATPSWLKFSFNFHFYFLQQRGKGRPAGARLCSFNANVPRPQGHSAWRCRCCFFYFDGFMYLHQHINHTWVCAYVCVWVCVGVSISGFSQAWRSLRPLGPSETVNSCEINCSSARPRHSPQGEGRLSLVSCPAAAALKC